MVLSGVSPVVLFAELVIDGLDARRENTPDPVENIGSSGAANRVDIVLPIWVFL